MLHTISGIALMASSIAFLITLFYSYAEPRSTFKEALFFFFKTVGWLSIGAIALFAFFYGFFLVLGG